MLASTRNSLTTRPLTSSTRKACARTTLFKISLAQRWYFGPPLPLPPKSPQRLPFNSGGRDRAAVGVFTPKAAALLVVTGVGLYLYFENEKRKVQERRRKELETVTSVGRPSVGGPFNLITHTNQPFTEKDLVGKWNFIYFGFTNCPDICPAELDKVTAVVNTLENEYGKVFQPIFISVDPARDTLQQISMYLRDFHPAFIGTTSPSSPVSSGVDVLQPIKSICKAYRVYFSTPPNADPKGDYLVDHSIFIYFMDPRGDFVEAFGQSASVDEVVERVRKEIGAWIAGEPRYK